MKINNEPPDSLKSLFAVRANPWAPKYEQELWNDSSVGQFESTVEGYKDILLCAAAILDCQMQSQDIAFILRRYNDAELSEKTNAELLDVKTMRRDMMRFLNSTTLSTNCYAYALNMRRGFPPGSKLTPGQLDYWKDDPTRQLHGNLRLVFDGLARDGIEWFKGDPNKDKAPEGYYLAAFMTKLHPISGWMEDYHFIRYDRDGGCSHKTGHGYVTNLDHKGRVIADPTTQEIMPGYEYKGCVMVPAVLPQHRYA